MSVFGTKPAPVARPFMAPASTTAAAGDPASPPLPAPAAADTADLIVPLSRPLPTHQGDIRQITLKAPNGGDYIDIGDVDKVYVLGVDEVTKLPSKLEHTVDREALLNYMVRLSGLDRVILRTLAPQDFGAVAAAVRRLVMVFAAGNSQSPPA